MNNRNHEVKEDNNQDVLNTILLFLTLIVILPLPFWIALFFNFSAVKEHWGRLLFSALLPFGGGWILIFGIIPLVISFFGLIQNGNFWLKLTFFIIFFCVVTSIIERWIARLVFENLPVVGLNPDNIDAVIGLNNIWYALRGLGIGVTISAIVLFIRYGLYLIIMIAKRVLIKNTTKMSIKCKLGFHNWNGCKCSDCGKTRDEQHQWTKDCEKCSICDKTRDNLHNWSKDCEKCSKCGKTRENKHSWEGWKGCKCTYCGITRDEQHDWTKDCEKCSKCGGIRENQHTWNGCKCSKCGKIRDKRHAMDSCKCSICGKEQHAWVERKCIICGETNIDTTKQKEIMVSPGYNEAAIVVEKLERTGKNDDLILCLTALKYSEQSQESLSKGDFNNVLLHSKKAETIFEKIPEAKYLLSIAKCDISAAYGGLKDNKNCVRYAKECLAIVEDKTELVFTKGTAYMNLGMALYLLGMPDESLINLKKAYDLFTRTQNGTKYLPILKGNIKILENEV
jgi:hypothetical protein